MIRLATIIRLAAVLAGATVMFLLTPGTALAACSPSYQAGGNTPCGDDAALAATAAVAAAAALGVAASLAITMVSSGSAGSDLATLDQELLAQAQPSSDESGASGQQAQNLAAVDPLPDRAQVWEEFIGRLNANDHQAKELLERYYKKQAVGQAWIPRRPDRELYKGYEVPEIERIDGIVRMKDIIPADYFPADDPNSRVVVGDRATLTPARLEIADTQARMRYTNLQNLAEARYVTSGELTADNRWGAYPLDKVDLSGFALMATKVGEQLGETAGEHAVQDLKQRMPSGYKLIPELAEMLGGPGQFDLIYRVLDPDGQLAGFIVVEAKGPQVRDLGSRRGLDGKVYEQGHREYLRSVIAEMRKDSRFASLATELDQALQHNKIDYFLVRASVTHDGGGIPFTALTQSTLEDIHQQALDAHDALGPEVSEVEARETYRTILAKGTHGTSKYSGYKMTQFNLGYPPAILLRPQ